MADVRQTQFVTAILYQNSEHTVTLLDIPRSIALAQGTPEGLPTVQKYSSQPLEAPYPSTEPKSEKAKANVLQRKGSSDTTLHFPETTLRQALAEIAEHYDDDWCLPRKISPFAVKRNKKPTFEEPAQPVLSIRHRDPGPPLGSLSPAEGSRAAKISKHFSLRTEPDLRIPEEMFQSCRLREPLVLCAGSMPGKSTCQNLNPQSIANRLVCNPIATPISLQCSNFRYIIPPNAMFLLSKIGQATALSMAALTMLPDASTTAGPGQFDFILLDPPWENRSVRRSAIYETTSNSHPMAVLQGMLGQHIAPEGLVACWVTSKASTRDAALEAFDNWNVQLIEVWAWLKTTVYGVPVTEIEGLWRMPYELLLVGRRDNKGSHSPYESARTRVMVAVPDIHSQKPNLKEIIEPFLPPRYRALEIFARNLTAGWFAWGDEVLKYSWEGYWPQTEDVVGED